MPSHRSGRRVGSGKGPFSDGKGGQDCVAFAMEEEQAELEQDDTKVLVWAMPVNLPGSYSRDLVQAVQRRHPALHAHFCWGSCEDFAKDAYSASHPKGFQVQVPVCNSGVLGCVRLALLLHQDT